MVKRQKDGRYKIIVHVWKAGKIEHTVPCPKINCPVCLRLQGNQVDREFAKEIECEFENQLKTKRKEKSSLTSIKYIRDALDRYKSKHEFPGGASSTLDRLIRDLGDKSITQSYSSLSLFVESQKAIGELANSSINRHIQMLKAAVNDCFKTRFDNGDMRLIPENYLSSFPLLEEQNINYLILSNDQMDRFWKALDPRLKPFVYFAWRVPVREGEAFNLTREHIDPFNRVLKLPYEYTKQGDIRQIKIVDEFWPYVKSVLASPAQYLFNRGEQEGYAPLGYADRSANGKIVFSLRSAWKAACESVPISGYNLHKCRQQAVMHLCAQGWSEDDIRVYGGWAPKGSARDAFYHYYNREMALWIRQGQHNIDLSWHEKYAEEFQKVA